MLTDRAKTNKDEVVSDVSESPSDNELVTDMSDSESEDERGASQTFKDTLKNLHGSGKLLEFFEDSKDPQKNH